MNKIFLDKDFLLGLYLFLRYLQLSIDRGLDSDWRKLVEYIESKTPINNVLNKLKTISAIDLERQINGKLKSPSFLARLLSVTAFRQNYLTEEEFIYIYSRLLLFSVLQSDSTHPNRDILIELRMDLQCAEELLKNRVDKKSLSGKEYVEHFNQNEILNCRSIDELIGKPWLC